MHTALLGTLAVSTLTTAALAVGPFTEDFNASSSNWFDAPGVSPVSWSASGGPDAGAHAATSFNFASSPLDTTPAFFRAHDEFGSSGNAFVGNYIADGITQMTYAVRHSAPAPLNFFARFAGPGNFPGAAAVEFIPVLPNTWTTITVNFIDPNPAIVYEGPASTFNSVFSSVGHVQIGAMVPASLAMQDVTVSFDLDKVTLIPAPACGLLIGGLALVSRRRRTINA